jgi:hypothetical protein
MTEHSGGHYLETRDGVVPLDHPVSRSVEAPAVTAWRAYTDHTRMCEQCRPSPRDCDTSNRLWAAYTDTGRTA